MHSEDEIAIGTALTPVGTIHGFRMTVRLARHMLKTMDLAQGPSMADHDRKLLERVLGNLGDCEEWLHGIEQQHQEWTHDLTGKPR